MIECEMWYRWHAAQLPMHFVRGTYMIVCDIFWRLQHSAARQLMHFIHPPRMTLAYMVTNKKRKENGALSAYLAQGPAPSAPLELVRGLAQAWDWQPLRQPAETPDPLAQPGKQPGSACLAHATHICMQVPLCSTSASPACDGAKPGNLSPRQQPRAYIPDKCPARGAYRCRDENVVN